MKPTLPDGWRAKFDHRRVTRDGAEAGADTPPGEYSPQGGSTVVRVYDPDGELAAEVATRIHPRDNFCKRIGRDVSLGRAIRQLRLEGRL